MISCLVALSAGAVVAGLLWAAAGDLFSSDAFARTNYRNAPLVTGVGVLIPVTMVLVAAAARVLELAADRFVSWELLVGPALVAGAGFSLLGLLDDLAGVGQSGGFRGHLRALGDGRLTSGTVKLAGGAALGVVVASSLGRGDEGVLGLLRDGAVVALAANLANLLDRAPGRAVKASAVGFVAAALVARSATLVPAAVGVGAGVGLLGPDLRERCMLGDAGANPLGALCGLAALVAAPGATARWLLLLGLFVLNAVSEVVSFSRVIDAVGPLRWLDRLGSMRT